MRKFIKLIAVTMFFVFIISGCGIKDDTTDNGKTNGNGTTTDSGDTTDNGNASDDDTSDIDNNQLFKAEVIETGDSLLITPDEDSNEFRSSDKISVSVNDAKILNVEGEEIAKEDLKIGDRIEVTYNGVILESYPAQISASSIKVVDHNILMEGYLALIDDLYNEDEALNSEIKMIAFDTTEWVDLTDIEKEIIFTKVKKSYGYEVVEGTYEELGEQGNIDIENLFFPEGILITLSNMKYDKEKSRITCATKKWRSGLGAIGSDDVTAQYNDGEWKITKEGMWIS